MWFAVFEVMRKPEIAKVVLGLFLACGCPDAQAPRYFPLLDAPVLTYEVWVGRTIPGGPQIWIKTTEIYSEPRMVGDMLLRNVAIIDSAGTRREVMDTCRFRLEEVHCMQQGSLFSDPSGEKVRTEYFFQGKSFLEYKVWRTHPAGSHADPVIPAKSLTEFYEEGTGLVKMALLACDKYQYCSSFSRELVATDGREVQAGQLLLQVRTEGQALTLRANRWRLARGASPAVLDLLGRQLPSPSRSMPLFPAPKTR
jgi:hypothetical protein